MREIKFRAWDKAEGGWVEAVTYALHTSGRLIVWPPNIELTQYTGLKDKNGKEIYEGDIVNYLEMNLTVAWSDTLARPILRPYTIAHHYDLNADVAEECEVIGNIYETPELMPKEDKE